MSTKRLQKDNNPDFRISSSEFKTEEAAAEALALELRTITNNPTKLILMQKHYVIMKVDGISTVIGIQNIKDFERWNVRGDFKLLGVTV